MKNEHEAPVPLFLHPSPSSRETPTHPAGARETEHPSAETIHDVSRVVSSILASLRGARRASELHERARGRVDDAIEAAELAATLVREMGRRSARAPGCSLAPALDQAVAIARPFVAPPTELCRLYVGGPMVAMYRASLVRVVFNLLLNAARATDSSRPGSAIRIRTKTRPGRVTVVIEDEGPGLPPSVLAQLEDGEEPAFAEARVGLGIRSTQQLLAQHGGALRYRVEPGGTSAFVELPLLEEP